MHRTIEKHTTNSKNCIPTVGGDFDAELGPGCGRNKRGDWMNRSAQHDVQKDSWEANDLQIS